MAAPVNQALNFFGAEPLRWLQEPTGIFEMLGITVPTWVPAWAAGWVSGPSLALIVIMIYSIWVFVGYDTVIYLAGLGNISKELIEAAEIDGAGRWQVVIPLARAPLMVIVVLSFMGSWNALAWQLNGNKTLRRKHVEERISLVNICCSGYSRCFGRLYNGDRYA